MISNLKNGKITSVKRKNSCEKGINKYKRKEMPKNSSRKFKKPYIKQNIEREYKLFFQKKHDSYKAIMTENTKKIINS